MANWPLLQCWAYAHFLVQVVYAIKMMMSYQLWAGWAQQNLSAALNHGIESIQKTNYLALPMILV
jgi:hypothetical protein